jgi:hypothetical protein
VTLRVRVRDNDTGHEYDLPAERFEFLAARGAVREIEGGRHEGRPRPPKHNVPAPRVAAKPIKTTRTKTPGEPTNLDAREEHVND